MYKITAGPGHGLTSTWSNPKADITSRQGTEAFLLLPNSAEAD
jgi:hypothetical protein